MRRLVLLSKSTWMPSIRREHALAAQAARRGIAVDFVECPSDVRSVRITGLRSWLSGLTSLTSADPLPGVRTHSRCTLVPGHRHPIAALADNTLLRRSLRRLLRRTGGPDGQVVVVNLPWQWQATAGLGVRRVFDAADDWDSLLAGKRRHVRDLYARIAAEADSVVVANEGLASLFEGRRVQVAANGTPAEYVADLAKPRPGGRRLVYVGTLSQRFDEQLVDEVLQLLPGWTLDLYGECRYPGSGSAPSAALRRLLDRPDGRAVWHGPVGREAACRVIDAADVALVPNRPEHSRGQSSMKFGDYAARGRPIVSTRWDPRVEVLAPPGTWFASSSDKFATAVLAADASADRIAAQSIAWARRRTWDSQWDVWAAAVLPPTARPESINAGGGRGESCFQA